MTVIMNNTSVLEIALLIIKTKAYFMKVFCILFFILFSFKVIRSYNDFKKQEITLIRQIKELKENQESRKQYNVSIDLRLINQYRTFENINRAQGNIGNNELSIYKNVILKLIEGKEKLKIYNDDERQYQWEAKEKSPTLLTISEMGGDIASYSTFELKQIIKTMNNLYDTLEKDLELLWPVEEKDPLLIKSKVHSEQLIQALIYQNTDNNIKQLLNKKNINYLFNKNSKQFIERIQFLARANLLMHLEMNNLTIAQKKNVHIINSCIANLKKFSALYNYVESVVGMIIEKKINIRLELGINDILGISKIIELGIIEKEVPASLDWRQKSIIRKQFILNNMWYNSILVSLKMLLAVILIALVGTLGVFILFENELRYNGRLSLKNYLVKIKIFHIPYLSYIKEGV